MRALSNGNAALLDLGTGTGGSLRAAEKRFNVRGLGVDLSEGKVQRAQSDRVLNADVMALELPTGSLRIVTAFDFLEHLPSAADAIEVLRKSLDWARDLVFVRHPTFEPHRRLDWLRLKVSWTDWHGHCAPIRLASYRTAAHASGARLVIVPRKWATHSHHPSLIPASAPTDTTAYEPSLGPRRRVPLVPPIALQFDLYFVPTGSTLSYRELLQHVVMSALA